jgi:mannose-6-phosphate isomerase class I
MMVKGNPSWRKTTQALAPARALPSAEQYDIYPAFPIGSGKIAAGYAALAERLAGQRRVTIDGYGGVFWSEFRQQLNTALLSLGIRALWRNVSEALLPEDEVDRLVAPFLGGDDPLFGTRFTRPLADFFDAEKLKAMRPGDDSELSIIYGCGAALSGWDSLLVYVDVPKNEIQFRSRSGSITNLGASSAFDAKAMYKRFYFVDWTALNQHKAELLARIDLVVDEQRPDEPLVMTGADLRAALDLMSRNYFRARPWFEPGPWGGQWIRQHIRQLPQDVPNYAWSFELISPENGLTLESDGYLLEVSFDFLMYRAHGDVLGHAAERFGCEFPIRFDFLDTFNGGNLSLQCHPRPEYIRRHFGETFTQDETYYILDCTPAAHVYLGFKEDINPQAFRAALERSRREAAPVDVERFVQCLPARRHDLFLIPNGTIHCSGVNNLVLEISATPYIFTFKMYDWMRLDLDGRPRPLNIERAFENLYFERKGARVQTELIAKPRLLQAADGWRLIHLPTHPDHFYDVHRLEFEDRVEVATDDSGQVMSLVEGESILLETAGGLRQRFHFAETFVVPAAAGSFTLTNEGRGTAKVVKSFVKR